MTSPEAQFSVQTVASGTLKLSELMGAFSYALDITEGQPPGHCVRCCWIGMHVGGCIGLSQQQLWELYYTLLLKDIGCSSNAARFRRIMSVIRNADELSQELIATRCQRGAEIARLLRFPEAVARGIHCLDEHFNGKGRPEGLKGPAIPIYARIALLSQVVDVFHSEGGRQAALDEARLRSGRWFDPDLVEAFVRVSGQPGFWDMLASPQIDQAVLQLEPMEHQLVPDDDYLDDIAAAFGQVVDAKSPYTGGHSARVAQYADMISGQLGLSSAARRWLKRGALLHDVGKLGVSNSVLDKAGSLDAQEWEAVRRHAAYTETILGRIAAFERLAKVAGAHHERLDGAGYPKGLSAQDISIETRIITTADIFDAITAERPYRGAIPVDKALDMMQKTVGTALDPDCFRALRDGVGVQG